MIYTIGYQKMTRESLIQELQDRKIEILMDVRSKPASRKAAFNKNPLFKVLEAVGIGYMWKGDTLGGFKEIKESAIRDLAKFQADIKVCLMCMEHNPDECHRKNDISKRLEVYGVSVEHICT